MKTVGAFDDALIMLTWTCSLNRCPTSPPLQLNQNQITPQHLPSNERSRLTFSPVCYVAVLRYFSRPGWTNQTQQTFSIFTTAVVWDYADGYWVGDSLQFELLERMTEPCEMLDLWHRSLEWKLDLWLISFWRLHFFIYLLLLQSNSLEDKKKKKKHTKSRLKDKVDDLQMKQ